MDIIKPLNNLKINSGVNRMCQALSYSYENKLFITHFTDFDARILVKTSTGFMLAKWGRRIDEKSKLPLGGWVSQELKAKGIYDKFFPKEVKISAVKFMELDIQGRCVWSDVTAGCWIDGLLLTEQNEHRVYIETFAPARSEIPFSRWPLISVG